MFNRFWLSKICIVFVCVLLVCPVSVFSQSVDSSISPAAENVHAASGFNYVSKAELWRPGQEIETTDATKILDFEDKNDWDDVTDRYPNFGLKISGARILTQGGFLNSPRYVPNSGLNVVFDYLDPWNGITFVFDEQQVGVNRFGFYYTARYSLKVSVWGQNGNILREDLLTGPNYFPVGVPNQKYEIKTQEAISKVKISTVDFDKYFQGVNSFTLDDVFFDRDIQCGVSVTKYFQTDPRWANDHYGEPTWQGADGYAPTIKNWGCALTSATMMLNQQLSKVGLPEITPHDLSLWLQQNDGYSGGHISFVKVGQFAKDKLGLDIQYLPKSSLANDQLIKSALCSTNSVIMEVRSVRGQHFVLARGFNHQGYLMNDPFTQKDELLSEYPNGPISIRYFAPIKDNQAFELLYNGTFALKIIDPAGREMSVGFGASSSSSSAKSEIQDGNILLESLTAEGGLNPPTIVGTRAMIQYMLSGVYTLEFSSLTDDALQGQINITGPFGISQFELDEKLVAGNVYTMQVDFKRANPWVGDQGHAVFSDLKEKTFNYYLPLVAN